MIFGSFYLVGFDTLVFGLFLLFSEIDEFLLHFIASEHINFAPESFVEIIIKFEIGVIPVQNTLWEVQVYLEFEIYFIFIIFFLENFHVFSHFPKNSEFPAIFMFFSEKYKFIPPTNIQQVTFYTPWTVRETTEFRNSYGIP